MFLRSHPTDRRLRPLSRAIPAIAAFAAAIAALATLSGCAPASVSTARRHISAGNFMAARQELIATAARKNLTPLERRDVDDDLCLADFMIGRPTVSLAEQRRACSAAIKNPGSQSAAIVAQLDQQSKQIDTAQVEAALADRDLAGAERAATDYHNLPGADPAVLAGWSKDIWTLADQQMLTDSRNAKRNLAPTIAELRKDYPEVRRMDDAQFRQWILRTAHAAGTPLASNLELDQSRLKLSIDSAGLQLAALNLDKLAIINDAFAARCACDAHTDVSVTQSGLPAYIVRLDPETRMSEVMILPRGDSPGLISSAR